MGKRLSELEYLLGFAHLIVAVIAVDVREEGPSVA
jgi:hypothetical protein